MSADDLLFNVLDWEETDEYNETEKTSAYVVRTYGRTEDGRSVYLKMCNFNPYFLINVATPTGDWNDRDARQHYRALVDELKRKHKGMQDNRLVSYDLVDRKPFLGFRGGETRSFVRLFFRTKRDMQDVARNIERQRFFKVARLGAVTLSVCESNIDPMLRVMHLRDLRPCGWIRVADKDMEELDDDTSCQLAVSCDWRKVHHHEVPRLTRFRLCSYDIECTSADGSFPQAFRRSDAIIQIGMVFAHYGDAEPYKRVIITLGSCDPIPDVVVVACRTEKELLLEYVRQLRTEDPDVRVGYNIFGFDEEYIKKRADLLGVYDRVAEQSRLLDQSSRYVERELCSAGLGDNKLKYFASYGRVAIDLLKVVQRDEKLSSYKLDLVAEHFFKGKMTRLSCEPGEEGGGWLYRADTDAAQMLRVGNYIKLESDGEVAYDRHRICRLEDSAMYFRSDTRLQTEESAGSLRWCMVKDDIKPADIFSLQAQGPAERRIVAEYCIQDCVLVAKLMHKLDVLTRNVCLANVSYVPLSYIFLRGQGIKCYSLVSRLAAKRGYVVPLLQKIQQQEMDDAGEDAGSYEGATVFEPEIGFHREPVPVLDYNSLYPSSIIERNISHETLVLDDAYNEVPGVQYQNVRIVLRDADGRPCGEETYRYAQPRPEEGRGVIPSLLEDLLSERKRVKREMAKEEDPFRAMLLDGLQLALKVTANSVYGQLGSTVGPLGYKPLAASTTATGRERLEGARDFVEQQLRPLLLQIHQHHTRGEQDALNAFYDAHLANKGVADQVTAFTTDVFDHYDIKPRVVYGDSVLGHTPVLIRTADREELCTIESLAGRFGGDAWTPCLEPGRQDKEACELRGVECWSDVGWTPLRRIIRHALATHKSVVRVVTSRGLVDVTDDHSLLDRKGRSLKPTEVKLGQTALLYRALPPASNATLDGVGEDDAWVLGRIFAESPSRESLPPKIVSARREVCEAFLRGIVHSSGDDPVLVGSQLAAAQLLHLAQTCGWSGSVDTVPNCQGLYRVQMTTDSMEEEAIVKRVEVIAMVGGYVYDLTTDNHHFSAGIGQLVVHNTDSIFCNMGIVHRSTGQSVTDRCVLELAIKLGNLASWLIKAVLPHPHNLEYEKTFYPLLLVRKKGYYGNKYENDPNKFKAVSMGIVLKRRDNAPVVKKIVGGLLDILVNEIDVDRGVAFVRESVRDLLDGRFPLQDFVTTKTLRGSYSGKKLSGHERGEKGSWSWDDVECALAHVALAQRIKARDPGNAPQVNDRIPYVFVELPGGGKGKGQKDKVETPDYIEANRLDVDYLHYLTNQIQNPTMQFLDLMMDPEQVRALFQQFIDGEKQRRADSQQQRDIKALAKHFVDIELPRGHRVEDPFGVLGIDLGARPRRPKQQ